MTISFTRSVTFLAFIVTTSAYAQSAICTALMNQYVSANKEVSFGLHGGGIDNSAPRASLRTEKALLFLQSANLNLSLMVGNKCMLPSTPFDPNAYAKNAFKCGLATSDSDIKKECDRGAWKAGDTPVEAP